MVGKLHCQIKTYTGNVATLINIKNVIAFKKEI
jgi:hypothetical protein